MFININYKYSDSMIKLLYLKFLINENKLFAIYTQLEFIYILKLNKYVSINMEIKIYIVKFV